MVQEIPLTFEPSAFLAGDGEMRELTRCYDWSATSVGPISSWSVSLRGYVHMLLSSRFPMLIFWGPDLLCFYNDAFRPSLGNEGKHPAILGMPAQDAWSEVWDFTGPLVKRILSGGDASWFEDQLVPIYRNGQIEDVYWTFSYSPLTNDEGTIAGVLVTCTETTKAVDTVTQLQQSEARFRHLIEEAPVATCLFVGPEMRVEVINEMMVKAWGKDFSVINKPLIEALPELEGQPFLDLLAGVYTTGIAYQGVAAPVDLVVDGELSTYYYDFTYKPLFTEEGKVWAIINVSINVTDKVLGRKKLEESEARFRSLVENAPMAICVFSSKGRNVIELANHETLKTWGKDASVIGKPLLEGLPELIAQPFNDILNEIYETGQPFIGMGTPAQFEIDGVLQKRYYDGVYQPLFNAEGQVYAIMGMALDVSDQVVAKQALEENERNLRNTIRHAPTAICIFRGPQFVIEIANNSMFEFWGKTEDQVIGKPIFEAIPEAKDQGYEELMTTVMQTGEPFSANELPVTLPRGGKVQTVYINFAYEPMREVDGTISGIMATAIDVTAQVLARQKIEEVVAQRTRELAETNQALKEVNQELQRSNHQLEEFAHAASHDLKEPVRKIHFFTNQLKNQLTSVLTETNQHYFNRIENATERMANLIDDLLLYSHVSQRPHEKEPIDLTEKISRVLEDLDLDIQEKAATVMVGSLPTVNGYPRQLQQLFQNLLSNAIKYCAADIAPCVRIEHSQVTDNGRLYCLIEVIDNGIGFEQEHAEKIFQMFTRLHGRQEYSGTGVGLAIVKKIVENHEGVIRVESKPGVGSVFKVYLPIDE